MPQRLFDLLILTVIFTFDISALVSNSFKLVKKFDSNLDLKKNINKITVKTLLIDNYDSYTYNIYHLLGKLNNAQPYVVFNDDYKTWDELIKRFPEIDNIVISPGNLKTPLTLLSSYINMRFSLNQVQVLRYMSQISVCVMMLY